MDCKRYEILLVDAQRQAMQTREWTEAQLLGSVAWLKRMNARGHDVLVRPASRCGLMLLDRLTQDEVTRLEHTGVPYGAMVEVHPDRFQIWLKLGGAGFSEKIAKVLSEKLLLPKPMEGQFGTLAGFVMHKPEQRRERARFVVSHEPGRPNPVGLAKWQRLLADAETPVHTKEREQSKSRTDGYSR